MPARITRTRLFAAATIALTALTLTACEGGTSDTGARGPASSAPGSPDATPSTGTGGTAAGAAGSGGGQGSGGTANGSGGSSPGTSGGAGATGGSSQGTGGATASGGHKGSGHAGSGGAHDTDDRPGKCSAANVRITATQLSRPLNHLLLTATNRGKKTCLLPAYPMARFGEAQSVPPVAPQTRPQAVTTLAPGQSGYAGVRLSAGDGSAEGGTTVHSLTVPFEDGSIATVSLPAKGLYVDSSLTVTYWQAGLDAAVDW
jgi:hypothetical protein